MDFTSHRFKLMLATLIGIVCLIIYKSYEPVLQHITAASAWSAHPSSSLIPPDLFESSSLKRSLTLQNKAESGALQPSPESQNAKTKEVQINKPVNSFSDKPPFSDWNFNTQEIVLSHNNWSLAASSVPYRALVLQDEGTFLQRLSHFNNAISALRKVIWEARADKEWQDISKDINVVWGSYDDFFLRLSNFTHLRTLVLPWIGAAEHNNRSIIWSSMKDKSNILVGEFYPWLATQPLCMWIETPAFTKARWDGVFNRSCLQEYDLAAAPHSLEPVFLRGKPVNPSHYWPHDGAMYPSYFFTHLPLHVIYMHMAENAIIAETGDIFSQNLKLVPYSCSHDTNPQPPRSYQETPIYKDVFIITQFWCGTFFHKMLECLPRIAPYLEFLRSNEDIHVHVAENGGSTAEMLQFLGITSERLISGVCRAKVVYMPQGTPCGFPVPIETQLLSLHLRHQLKEKFPERYQKPRSNLVLVKRTGLRRFSHQDLMEKTMKQIAGDFNLDFKLFADNPTPPLIDAMEMFNRAVLIVAPHGAGLSNMLFSEPGTLVIEGVCNPPHVNMCFLWAAYGLGHRYHGVPSRGGCEDVVEVFPETMDYVIRTHLRMLQESRSPNQ